MVLKSKYVLPTLTLVIISFTGYYYNFAYQPCLGSACLQSIPLENQFRTQNREFFKSKGLTYLDHTKISSPLVHQIDVRSTERYLKNPKHFDALERKYGRLIAQGYVAPQSIRFINDKIGYGTFAEADIAQGEMVGEYTGEVKEIGQVKTTKYAWVYPVTHDQVGRPVKISLDASESGNEMRFVNHDYQPNAAMQTVPQGGKWHAVYIANRPIKKGEQILTDYGRGYWSGTRGEPFKFVNEDGTQNEAA